MLALSISGGQLQCLVYNEREMRRKENTKEIRSERTRKRLGVCFVTGEQRGGRGSESDTYPPRTPLIAPPNMKHSRRTRSSRFGYCKYETEKQVAGVESNGEN